MQEALRAGHGGDKADRRFVAVEAVALTLGRALDGASERGDGQQVGRLSRYLMEALRELRLTPATAADGSGPEDTWEAFARAMATPEVVYPTGAPVPWESPDARDRAG
ncbi:hypothetical protein AB0G79_07100 [Streptomyces sp. NPDC020807]|uniref:hypothetical protein n=1 Tax=Streptomyces sp. NPDC020807 TaxID=3155119 RepID=UPI0033D98E61